MNNVLQTSIRYVALCDDDKRVLTLKGFKKIDGLNTSNIKLFPSPYAIHEYVKNSFKGRKYNLKYNIKKIQVTYEVVDNSE